MSTGSVQLPVFANSTPVLLAYQPWQHYIEKCIDLMQSTLHWHKGNNFHYRSRRKLFLAYICFTVHKFIHTCSDVIQSPINRRDSGLAYTLNRLREMRHKKTGRASWCTNTSQPMQGCDYARQIPDISKPLGLHRD